MTLSLLKLTHHMWSLFLKPGDFVIDATCGNGHDSLVLASKVLLEGHGTLLCMDIQQQALAATKKRLEENFAPYQFKNIIYHLGCHSQFPLFKEAPKWIVYNLGYLPGSDKTVKTTFSSTLKSVKKGLQLLQLGGGLTLTLYSGHEEGKAEKEALLNFSKSLNKSDFLVFHQEILNRAHAPSTLTILKNSLPVVP